MGTPIEIAEDELADRLDAAEMATPDVLGLRFAELVINTVPAKMVVGPE